MYLSHLSLINFRNYSRLELDLTQGISLLQGNNAQGKTNFLEAVAYLATSRSLLSTAERELVNWLAWDEEPLPFARLVGELVVDGRRRKIEITLVQANAGSTRLKKEVRINGVSRRAIDLVGHMPVVLFLPQDIEMVAGAPGVRRRYMDIALCQLQADYCRSLSAYNKVVQQRNALLKSLRERGGSAGQLDFWNQKLVEHGGLIMSRRAAFLADLELEANQRQQQLTDGQERLHLRYVTSFMRNRDDADRVAAELITGADMDPGELEGTAAAYQMADAPAIADAFHRELGRIHPREVAAGMSLVGPHRDDIHFVAQGHDLRTYGSRGQQRTAALATKLGEVAVMHRALGMSPLLLLDDVMSELDATRRSFLLETLGSVQQALITTTDWSDFAPEFRKAARCLRVLQGRIQEIPRENV